jgi:nucleotide-binding universal stress UspA family protein
MNALDVAQWDEFPTVPEDARRKAEELLKRAVDNLSKESYQVFSELQVGLPKKAIPDYANQWKADLVLIGSHGQSAVTRFLLGSVAQAVLRSSPCSVEVVRPSSGSRLPSEGMKIVLATDGSEGSVRAVYAVANLPWPAKSQIKLVSVVQLLTPDNQSTISPLCSEYPTSLLEQVWKEAQARAEEAVADARKILTTANLNVCGCKSTLIGDARSVILDSAKAWGADLIVLGSHGRHGLDRLLIGSVSESVAIHAHCSVEVVRH